MTKTNRILLAMRAGAKTSREIAHTVRLNRSNVSVVLCRFVDLGIIERAGVLNNGARGRPYVIWRPKESAPRRASHFRS